MKDGDGAAIGREEGGPRSLAPQPTARVLLELDAVEVTGELSRARRRSLEALAQPALWLGRGAKLGEPRSGLLFGSWNVADDPSGRDAFSAIIWMSRGSTPNSYRSAALVFDALRMEAEPAQLLSPGRSWFSALEAAHQIGFRDASAVWLDAGPPSVEPLDPLARQEAAQLLPRLQDEIERPRAPEEGDAVSLAAGARPAGAVWGAAEERAFWRSVGAFAEALPPALRLCVSAASGFLRAPAGVLIAQGPGVASDGTLDASEQALRRLRSAAEGGAHPTSPFPGAPAPAASSLRRWLRDVEQPQAADPIAAYVWADDHAPPPAPATKRQRASLLRRVVAAIDEGAVRAAPQSTQRPFAMQPLDELGAARLAAYLADQVGESADEAWAALRRTDPARFFWSALALGDSRAIDGPDGSAEQSPIKRLSELARLEAFNAFVAAALPKDAPAPLEAPAFIRRLRRLAPLGAAMIVDEPQRLVTEKGEPAAWIRRLVAATAGGLPDQRRRMALAASVAADAAELTRAQGGDGWRRAAAALGAEAPRSTRDLSLLAANFGQRFAQALQRGALDGALFWRDAFTLCVQGIYERSPVDYANELRQAIAPKLDPAAPAGALALSLAEQPLRTRRPLQSPAKDALVAGRPKPRLVGGLFGARGDDVFKQSDPRGREPEAPIVDPSAPKGEPDAATGEKPPVRLAGVEAPEKTMGRDLRDGVRPGAPDRANGAGAGDAAGQAGRGAARPPSYGPPPADRTWAKQRAQGWRDNFEAALMRNRQRGLGAGAAQPPAVALAADGDDDRDRRAFQIMVDLADLEVDRNASQDALDEVAGPDVAWVLRQFLGLEFDPSSRAGAHAAPVRVNLGWRAFGLRPEADLDDPNTFFLFFASKSMQRALVRSRGPQVERFCVAFKQGLIGRTTRYDAGPRKILAPYAAWLRDHIYGVFPSQNEDYVTGLTDVEMAAKLDRALLFLSMVRVVREHPEGARESELWQPLNISRERLAPLDPPDAMARRMERYFIAGGPVHDIYMNAFEKIAVRNNFSSADQLGNLSRVIRRWRNMKERPN